MNYRIYIAKGENRFEAEGDKKFVLHMLEKYGGLEVPAPVRADMQVVKSKQLRTAPEAISSTVSSKKTSVGEFVRQLEVKKHMDLVVAFGYYLEKIAGLSSFTVADINNCYYDAKIENSNTSQMIIQNIKKGHMMVVKTKEDKGRQAFVLTRSGEDYITKQPAKKSK